MFQDNPLLQQLKAQIRETLPTVEGQVKATAKGYGFIETDKGESHFVPPPMMKKVVHGDRVSAVLREDGDKTSAEPEQLLEASLDRFIARVQWFKGRLNLVPDHPMMKAGMRARCKKHIDEKSLKDGDYVVAHLKRHPLREDDKSFLAEVSEFVAATDDPHVPWWVILAKHDLAKVEPEGPSTWQLDGAERQDLTALPFVTIDAASTKDMDDALYVERNDNGWRLTVAIADPTAYVQPGDDVDQEAFKRCLTQYLPGYNVPMLPRQLADELCSLVEAEDRPALCAHIQVAADGELQPGAEFFLATIRSQGKLAYDNVSDYLDEVADGWQPQQAEIAEQCQQLHALANARSAWRKENALVFPDQPDYRFEVDDNGNVLNIHVDERRTANRIVEECMIVANAACAERLSATVGQGIFNAHAGLDPERINLVVELLEKHHITFDAEQLLTMGGYCALRRVLDKQESGYLDARVRKLQAFAEVVGTPQPHYGMGLEGYATWTSPIRKYSDMVNHRLLKATIAASDPTQVVTDQLLEQLAKMRKLHRMCERHVGDWLYARYLLAESGSKTEFTGKIIDINRGGIRVKLAENGAVAFMPASHVSVDKARLNINGETAQASFDDELKLQVADTIAVTIGQVDVDQRSVMVLPVTPLGS
ncbi:exoribonuclease II [Ferrimonas lipolytica]|uniref:Exoribonuclease II n=1 Tax=Ferrimonas lipolytica TaxID=2724191 RepID=A0A6H1UHX1_9GAMM|nr:exoribonuclease II [Ferrimonas lipolytica]QIZ77816.1 exoribonuclease II [Ferrimonas lipolytica]